MNPGGNSDGFLRRVDESLDRALPRRDLLTEAARNLVLSHHAKRVRPMLVQYFGKLAGRGDDGLVPLAVAAELVHSASLLHDDVIDEASLRRGRPTANANWGNTVAILAGDWVLTVAFQELAGLDPRIVQDAVDTVSRMTLASMFEVTHRGNLDVSLPQWRAMAEGKTGSVFEWCARSVSRDVLQEKEVSHWTECARSLAVAFQMADDLKDLTGFATGKNGLSDIRNRDPNYAVLLSVSRDGAVAQRLGPVWSRPAASRKDIQEAVSIVLQTDAVERAMGDLEREISRAVDLMDSHRDHPWGRELIQWARSLHADLATGIPKC